MKDRLVVGFQQLASASAQMRRLAGSFDDAASSLHGITIDRGSGGNCRAPAAKCRLSGLGGVGALNAEDVSEAIRVYAAAIGAYADYARTLSARIAQIRTGFLDAEGEIALSVVSGYTPDMHEGVCDILGYTPDMSRWTDTMRERYYAFIRNSAISVVGGKTLIVHEDGLHILGNTHRLEYSAEDKSSFTQRKITERIQSGDAAVETEMEAKLRGKYSKKSDKLKIKQKEDKTVTYHDTRTGSEAKKSDYKDYSRTGTMLDLSAEIGQSVSAFSRDGSYENGGFSAKGKMDVLTASYNAGVSGGLYAYEIGEDGKKIRTFAPGVTAEVGASVSVFEAEGEMEYKFNDFVALSGKGDIAVATANADAKMEAGIIDGKLAASIRASAEADLVSAGGDVALDVAGIKGSVGGEVKVGIGAHADIGYSDGVLKFDVGAAVGLGLDIRADIDIGGFVDNAANVAKSAYDGVTSAIGEGFSALSKWYRLRL